MHRQAPPLPQVMLAKQSLMIKLPTARAVEEKGIRMVFGLMTVQGMTMRRD